MGFSPFFFLSLQGTTSISFHTASSGKPSAGGETAHEASRLWALPLWGSM